LIILVPWVFPCSQNSINTWIYFIWFLIKPKGKNTLFPPKPLKPCRSQTFLNRSQGKLRRQSSHEQKKGLEWFLTKIVHKKHECSKYWKNTLKSQVEPQEHSSFGFPFLNYRRERWCTGTIKRETQNNWRFWALKYLKWISM